jgi:nucleoside-diphosphate-sugar epimerase
MRVVAITGATGFIGRHLTARLAASGREVRAVCRVDSSRAAMSAPHVQMVRTPFIVDRLADAFRGADVVVHLAGLVRARTVDDFTRANVEVASAVARAARAAGARLIHVSSLAAAGPASPLSPRSEVDPSIPITAYGISKLAGERAVMETEGLRWTILRPGVVYGPQDAALLVLFRMAERGVLPLVGRSGAAYTFIHVDDMIRTIEAAIDNPLDGRTIFVGHREPVTTRLLLQGIRAATGRPAVILTVPLTVTRAAAALCDLTTRVTGRLLPLDKSRYAELAAEGFVCRVDLMRDLLGMEARVALSEGLAQTAAWYRANGLLRPAGSGR